MKKILSILAFVLIAIGINAQVYSNVPAGPIIPAATPFSAYWVNTATDAASGLSLLGGGTGSGTTNFLLSGVVAGQTTNNTFSTSGSNIIQNIAQQYAGGSNSINNLNGFGTNTTLRQSVYIGVTNLTVHGNTYLNNSNVFIYLYGYSGNSNGIIPYMTGSNTPSGLATANTNTAGRDAYLAFQPINQGGASSWAVSSTFGLTSNWLQYKFDAPVTVFSNSFGLNINGGSFFLQSSMDGTSWNLITNQTLPSVVVNGTVTNGFAPVTAIYFRWLFTNLTAPPSIAINDNKLFGTGSQGSVISNSYSLSILATNGGVAIGTNSAGTNALEVLGNIDSTVGFTVNGQPIGGAAASPIGIYSQLYVTNATGTATNYNGIYTSAGSYFTNNATGWFIVAPATWYPNATTIPRTSYTSYGLVTNLISGTITPAFSNSTLIGTYSGNPTNIFPNVSPYYPPLASYTNFSGTIGAGGISGFGIDTNLSSGQLAAAGVVTNNPIKLLSPSGGSSNPLNDLKAGVPSFVGQLGATWNGFSDYGTYILGPAFTTNAGSFVKSGLWLPGGIYQVGAVGVEDPDVGAVNWYFNAGKTNATQANGAGRDGSYFYLHNLQVFGDGAGLCVPHYSTNSAGGTPALTNADGVVIYLINSFGNQFLTISEQDPQGETNQAGSYVWLVQPDLPTYISCNKTLSGESGGFYSQHYFQGFDMANGFTHFAKLVPYVWTFTNVNNLDALTINNNNGNVEATNGKITLGSIYTNMVLNAGLIRVRPTAGYDDTKAGLAVNTNAAFSREDSAWTFDSDVNSHRLGFVKQAGNYPKFVHASGSPLTVSQSSASDLQTTAVASQTLTSEIVVNADHTTSFGYAISVANQAVCPTPSAGIGWFWNSNSVLYWVTSTKTNLVSNGQ